MKEYCTTCQTKTHTKTETFKNAEGRTKVRSCIKCNTQR